MSYTILTQSAAHGGLSKVARAYSQAKQTQGEYKFDLRDGTYLVPSIFYKQGQASATVTCCGVDVTDEYIENAFHWTRDSGNIEADTVWNAAHAGMKSITFAATDIDGDVKISCTLTASSATYGSITVDDDLDASHTPAELDANDVFVIENGYLKVTTSRGNAYVLENGALKAAGAKLNGSIVAETKLFASQPENMVEFSYDHNGLRTQKKMTKADGTVETTDYTLHGKLIAHLTRGEDEMHFFYDNESRPAMVEFNGTLYGYVHNLQGDIVGIIDNAGNLVVEYVYDAWGKPVVVRTLTTAYEALAELNPFRYRGYVFDEEMEAYYLKERYYWPELGRMINTDIFLGEYLPLLKYNAFCYCANSPLMLNDVDGREPVTVWDCVLLAISLYVLAFSNPDENYDFSDTPRGALITQRIFDSNIIREKIDESISQMSEEQSCISRTFEVDWPYTKVEIATMGDAADIDLALAVGRVASFQLTVERVYTSTTDPSQSIYRLTYVISDRYNFDPWTEEDGRGEFATYLNNEFGYRLQSIGALTSYNWTCSGSRYWVPTVH